MTHLTQIDLIDKDTDTSSFIKRELITYIQYGELIRIKTDTRQYLANNDYQDSYKTEIIKK